MVEDGLDDEADFRDFTFANTVRMHTRMNPNFFKGTVVEDAVEKLKSETRRGGGVRRRRAS